MFDKKSYKTNNTTGNHCRYIPPQSKQKMNTLLQDGISGGAPKLHTSRVTRIKVDLCTQKFKHVHEFACSFSCSFTVSQHLESAVLETGYVSDVLHRWNFCFIWWCQTSFVQAIVQAPKRAMQANSPRYSGLELP